MIKELPEKDFVLYLTSKNHATYFTKSNHCRIVRGRGFYF